MKSQILPLLVLLASSTMLFSQEIEVPNVSGFEDESEYEKYEPQVKECINWLLQTPIGEQKTRKKKVGKFFMLWVEGTPKTTVQLDEKVLRLIDKNDELLLVYLAGWAGYELEHGINAKSASNAALKGVVELYKNSPQRVNDPDIEKILKKIEKGKMKL